MATTTDARLADALEELALLRAGKPFHVHRDVADPTIAKRCSSAYCVDLTMTGIRLEGPNA